MEKTNNGWNIRNEEGNFESEPENGMVVLWAIKSYLVDKPKSRDDIFYVCKLYYHTNPTLLLDNKDYLAWRYIDEFKLGEG